MGGCASKPKELDGPNPEAVPAESPAAPEPATAVEGGAPTEAEAESVDEPSIDVSQPTETGEAEEEEKAVIVVEETEVAKEEKEEVGEATGEAEKEMLVAAEEHPLQ